MSSFIKTVKNLLDNDKVVYSDILIQENQNIRVYSPGGWDDVAEMIDKGQMIQFAQTLTGCSSETELKQKLSTTGACNVGCMISKKRVRIDISLVSSPDRTLDMDDESLEVQYSVLELCIRRHRQIIPLDQLHLPKKFTDYLSARSGLILLTGQTASGKTSTAASALDYINQTRSAHIITIEDPIEYMHVPALSVFSPKEVGRDCPDIATATYDALRQRPDVIFISELRDRESCKQALYASQSALVITTTHAPSLEEGLERILNFFPNEELGVYRALKSSLRCVVSQTLLQSHREFAMFHEYVQGSSEIVQKVLESGNGLTEIRAALNEQSDLQLDRFDKKIDKERNGYSTDALASNEEYDRKSTRLTGFVSVNVELAKAVESGDISIGDAQRSTPDDKNFATVHAKYISLKNKEKANQSAQRVPVPGKI